ncbi:MAG TPA: hypothetical protein VKS81_10950 [Bacteroidota bacterium]|nr:hypothetical protein [Bacteroidota bacterium]
MANESDRFDQVLGRITRLSTLIENRLRIDVSTVVYSSTNLGLKLTSTIYTDKLIKMLRVAVKHLYSEDIYRQFESVIRDIEKCENERNIFVHSMWAFENAKNYVRRRKFKYTPKKGLNLGKEDIDIDSIIALANRILIASENLSKFLDKLLLLSPRTHEKINPKETNP